MNLLASLRIAAVVIGLVTVIGILFSLPDEGASGTASLTDPGQSSVERHYETVGAFPSKSGGAHEEVSDQVLTRYPTPSCLHPVAPAPENDLVVPFRVPPPPPTSNPDAPQTTPVATDPLVSEVNSESNSDHCQHEAELTHSSTTSAD